MVWSHASLSKPRVTETPLVVDPTLPKLFRNRRAAGPPRRAPHLAEGGRGHPPGGRRRDGVRRARGLQLLSGRSVPRGH